MGAEKLLRACSNGRHAVPQSGADVIQRVVDKICNEGDVDLADELFSESYVNHGGLITDLVSGPEAVKVSVALLRLAFPDLRVTIGQLTQADDVHKFDWKATTRAKPASGTSQHSGALGGTGVARVFNGQVLESWMAWDRRATSGIVRSNISQASAFDNS